MHADALDYSIAERAQSAVHQLVYADTIEPTFSGIALYPSAGSPRPDPAKQALVSQRSHTSKTPAMGYEPGGYVSGIALPRHISPGCVDQAASAYHIPAITLLALLKIESGGKLGVVRQNNNGTVDLGPAQLNSGAWAQYFYRNYGVSASTMTHDMCASITMMAYALRTLINKAGGDFWRGVGNYHSSTPDKHHRYIRAVDDAQTTMLRRKAF